MKVRFALLCLLVACSSGGVGPQEPGGEPVADGPFGTTAAMNPDQLARTAESTLAECGGGCSSDLVEARAALESGDLLGARELYRCADSSEAAFGAGLSTILALIESERGDAVLDDLGLPHFPASDLFGSDGYLSRHAARANGSGELTLSGAVSTSIALESILFDGGATESRSNGGEQELYFELWGASALPAGSSTLIQYNCASQFAGGRIDGGPELYLTLDDRASGRFFECEIPFSVSDCSEAGGSFEVESNGTAIGDAVDIAFDNVRLDCFVSDESGRPNGAQSMSARLDGRIMGSVSGEVATADLHPLLRDGYTLDAVPAATRLRTFLAHASSITEDLAQAACFFDKAAEGTGVVFEVPDALAGSRGLSLTAADAKTLAAAATLAAALLQLAGVYDGDLAFKELLCLGDSNESTCATAEVVTANINAALQGGSVRRDRLSAARVFLEEGLTRFTVASGMLDGTTLVPRDARTSGGITVLEDFARAALASLNGTATVLPSVTPASELDLERFFEKLPEPGAVPGKLLHYEDICDDFECWSSRELDAEHATLLWPLGIDFTQRFEFMEPQGELLEATIEEVADSMSARFAGLADSL